MGTVTILSKAKIVLSCFIFSWITNINGYNGAKYNFFLKEIENRKI